MRLIAALVLTVSFGSIGLIAPGPIRANPADSPDVAGSWKMVLMPFGEDELAILDVKAVDGKIAAKVASGNAQLLGAAKTAEGTIEGDRIAIQFAGPGVPTAFQGVLDKDGKKAKGSFKFRGTTYPGRIERTEAKEVAKMQPSAIAQELSQATQTIKDPKERVAKIRELIGRNEGHPANAASYVQILGLGEAAGVGPEEVAKLVEKWTDEAKAYGPEWTVEVRSRALKALQGKKAYASLATEMALAEDKSLPADASTEQRSAVATMLATSAKLAGKDAIASEADARAKGYDAKLDAEYHEKVPPFKPETFAGRKDGKGTRVVLMEIFTGAECPPCVAADVAFDALLQTFKPTEFIGLQHHLHIPGPDPLTNADTVARQGYYGKEIGGTPSVFFNGVVLPGGGGGMAGSRGKYDDYRAVIDPAFGLEKKAEIALTATRSGDEVKIAAKATIEGASKDARPMLRLVLVEESVRYPGSNKLRFHHNVVRAFPGGVEGKAFEKGEGVVEATIKLSDLRKAQDAYLAQYPASPRGRAFPKPLPPIDLDDLAVVALVQDDADHGVWHAVQVPVKSETP